MGGKIKITLVRSTLGSKPSHRKTVKALGLRRINHTVEHVDTPQIRGMIFHVKHLVSVEE
ncbi:MAG TPA: 50S ribosomal protein L30 [Firmicutes bacterium]|jgi:large subunit ribosomal protein L30|nr:50S ribosomal protein L30 [Bacillota bacterium]